MRYPGMRTYPRYFEYEVTLQPMKVQLRSEMPSAHHIGSLRCPCGTSLSILSIATAQPPCGGMGIGLNRAGGKQTGLAPRPVVSLLTHAEIERVRLENKCDGSARGKL